MGRRRPSRLVQTVQPIATSPFTFLSSVWYTFTGADGTDGIDGVGCNVTKEGSTLTVTCASGSVDILDGVDGPDGADGADGEDGVGCSAEKNGTVATITCANGSVGVIDGAQGPRGANGSDGESLTNYSRVLLLRMICS